MSALTYVELFAGAGGLSLGLEAAGFEPVAHCEIEPHARAVLRYRWPQVRLDGDVSQVNGADFQGVTLVSGGSPCQDLSVAGKRAGLAGARSELFHQQVRIWQESGAPYLLWENVLGALSSNAGQDFAAVLSAIVGTAIPVPADGWRSGGVAGGPDAVAAWRVLDLQHFGPPQRRVRVFIVAARAGGVDPAEVLALSEGVCGHPSPREQARQRVTSGFRTGASVNSNAVTIGLDGEKNAHLKMMGTLNTGSKSGSGQQPMVTAFQNTGQGWWNEGDVAQTLRTPTGGDSVLANVIEFESTGGAWGVNEGDTSPPIKVGSGLQIASPPGVVVYSRGGFGAWTESDAVTALCARDAKDQSSIVSEVCSTLGAQNNSVTNADLSVVGTLDCGDIKWGNSQWVRQNKIRIESGRPRRLTPVECERLMSWPDQWTAAGVKENGTEYQLPDTARYRLCGNGVGSVCVAWFAQRLADLIEVQ
jgi:DNA (cytosine-5)-methyltransferase 1